MAIGAVLVALVVPAAANGAQRFASTTGGTTEPCNPTPCDLQTAFGGAPSGSEVIVEPGTYALGAASVFNVQTNVSVHGVTGQPKPLITGNPAAGALFGMGNANSSVADLVIDRFGSGTGPAFSIGGAGSVAERVEVTSTAEQGCQVESGALLRDSICVYSGSAFNSAALFTGGGSQTSAAQNVTAIGTGANSDGIRQLASSGASPVFNGRNVIAIGANDDIEVAAPAGSSPTLNLAFSNWDEAANLNGAGTPSATPVGSPTNQTAAPIFVNAGGGDYRQVAGSPTIDAGAADASTGGKDFEGQPRSQGASVDIGADEFMLAVELPAPTDTTPPETVIGKGPKKKTKSNMATFEFSSSEAGSTFVCKVDKKAEAPCASPLKLKKLKKGKHTLTVVATDAAGNVDATPASYRWKVKRKPQKR